jgi:hypothetical protein
MRKALAGLAIFLAGLGEWMTYNPPNEVISNISKYLSPFGIHPKWLQNPDTDKVVRTLGLIIIVGCAIYLFSAIVWSIRRAWKNREPKYPSPFLGRGKELLPTMAGNWSSNQDGIIELNLIQA